MRTPLLVLVSCMALGVPVAAQQKPPELTGTLSFDVGSGSGRVESLAVQIGDGGTGRYKAILAGDPLRCRRTPSIGHGISDPSARNCSCPSSRSAMAAVATDLGEFRNFLSDLASHGYLIVAIGPAGDAVVAGSEGRTNQTPRPRSCSMASSGRPGRTAGKAATTSGSSTWRALPSWGSPAAPGRRSKCRATRA